MFQGPGSGGGRRPPWRVLYMDKTITITSWYVELGRERIAVSELHNVVRCLTYRYPIVRVAAFTGGLEVLIAMPFAAVYGSALIAAVGVLSALGMVMGVWTDYRRNPRISAIEATIRGRRVVLFRTHDKQRFGFVWRALVRAVEDNRGPLP